MSKPLAKQSSLLGFFKKAPAPASSSNTPRASASGKKSATTTTTATPATPITPSTSHAGSSNTSDKSLNEASAPPSSSSALPAKARRSSASSASKYTIDLSSDGAIDEDDDKAETSKMQDYASKGTAGPAEAKSSIPSSSSVTAIATTEKKASSPPANLPTPPLTSENEDGTSASALTSASDMDVDGEEGGEESEDGNLNRVAKVNI